MNLYIISSPLQLVCAIESWLQLNKRGVFWIFLSKSAKANDFMQKLSKDYLEKEKVYYTGGPDPINPLIKKIVHLKYIKRSYKIQNLFIGNISEFSEKLCAININCERLWSLDDGAKTLVLKDFYTAQNGKINCFDKTNINAFIKLLILKFFSLRTSKNIVVNWFTIFDFKPNNGGIIHTHRLSNFKKKINFIGRHDNSSENEIYFIGTNLINAGVLNNAENYFKLLGIIRKCYSNKKVFYIPHRLEDSSDISRIRELGFEIKEFDHIIEIAFLEMNIYPCTIASFYSTALYSISKLFPETKVDFFELDQNYISPKFISSTKIVEKEYKTVFGIREKAGKC